MDRRLFKSQEIAGTVLSIIFTFLLWRLYDFTSGNPIGVLFGCVNNSIWEQIKAIILSYVAFALFELFTSKPYFKQFTAAKSVGLYASAAVYVIMRYAASGIFNVYTNCIEATVAVIIGYVISYKLTIMKTELRDIFAVACFMFFLVFMMYFSFTVFVPQLALFEDPDTGLYGIIPEYIDTGALLLDKIYG